MMLKNLRGRVSRLLASVGLATALGLGGAVSSAPALAAANCPEASVADAAGAAFLNAGKSASAAAFANALRSHTDMNRITLFALGKYRSQLPPARQGQLVSLTSAYVASTLADFALKFRGSGIKAIECQGGTVVSRMEFLGGKPAKRVVFKIAGGKVQDVNIQNVWLAQLLRDNFSGVIQKGGGNINALFAHLGVGSVSNVADVGRK
jgi:ABC-type transporter MlaC component